MGVVTGFTSKVYPRQPVASFFVSIFVIAFLEEMEFDVLKFWVSQ